MLKKITLAATCAASLAVTAAPAQAGPDAYIGEIMMFGGTFCPRGTVEANGQLMSIAENSALFSLFGINFGGDGRNTFGMPDLMSDAPRDIRYCVTVVGVYPSRS